MPRPKQHIDPNTRWFVLGLKVRLKGGPREMEDEEMTPENRAAFWLGWDEQDYRMQPPTDAQQKRINAIHAQVAAIAAQRPTP